jgi:acyl carrier protein
MWRVPPSLLGEQFLTTYESTQEAVLLSFDDFWEGVAGAARIDADAVEASTRLREDLDLDSLQMLELVLIMDELGAELIEAMIPAVLTVGDLYDHYCTRVSADS